MLVEIVTDKPHSSFKDEIGKKYGSGSQEMHRYQLYGLLPEEFDRMMERQDYKCACCSRHLLDLNSKQVHIDHNHALEKEDLGFVRGILCGQCNVGLGAFKEDVRILELAIVYLQKFEV